MHTKGTGSYSDDHETSSAIATLREGETAVDISCGSGANVFQAAHKVGPTGKAIGLDSSEDAIALARESAAKQALKPPHVAFVRTYMKDPLPIEADSVDCVFSSTIASLASTIRSGMCLWNETERILKPGRRTVLDDIIAKRPLPGNIAAQLQCQFVSDAVTYKGLLENAGFRNIVLEEIKSDLSVYYRLKEGSDAVVDINEWISVYRIHATKHGDAPRSNPPTVLLRWWDAYPRVDSTPPSVSAEEVAALIRGSAADPNAKAKFAVVDVRRNDHADGHVRGSYNRHAQTFYDDLPSVFEEFKDTPEVIFYCQSSNGRGPRCAGWYQDYLDTRVGEHNSQGYVLQGGVKNWLATFKGEEELVDFD